MKTIRILIPLLSLALVPSLALAGSHPGCTCGTSGKTSTADKAGENPATLVATKSSTGAEETKAPVRHPLKGVIVEVMADRSALLVKHEEIPGVMKAMTMMFKVDEAALKSAKKGAAVTGLLVRKTDGWWLEDVKVLAPEA